MQCHKCRKERNEPLSWLDRFRLWVLRHLEEELHDEKSDAFTNGFGQGYARGGADAKAVWEADRNFQKQFETVYPTAECAVSLVDVLDARPDGSGGYRLYIGGQEASRETVTQIKAEVEFFERSRLWYILQETVKQKAIEKAVLQSTKWEECLAGKMLLHDVGLRKSMLEAVKRADTKI